MRVDLVFGRSVEHHFSRLVLVHVNVHHLRQPLSSTFHFELLFITFQLQQSLLPVHPPMSPIHLVPLKHCTCVQIVPLVLFTRGRKYHWTLFLAFFAETLPVSSFLFVIPALVAVGTWGHLNNYRLCHYLNLHFHWLRFILTRLTQNFQNFTFPILDVFFIFPTNVPFIFLSITDTNAKLLIQPMFLFFQFN